MSILLAALLMVTVAFLGCAPKEVGKPVISSVSATLYGILKKLGIPDPVYHYGGTLTTPRVLRQIGKGVVK